MALNIEDKETERMAAEIASLAGESETDAVRQSVRERRDRLQLRRGERRRPRSREELLHFMETEIWPLIPAEHRGKPPMTKAEREEILGTGPEGC